MTVLAATKWTTNAHMIEACVELGYLKHDDYLCDPTYGGGRWWKRWKPVRWQTSDLSGGIDFRELPWADGVFDVAVLDPPYVCTGGRDTSTLGAFNDAYGLTATPRTPVELQVMNEAGLKELVRVVKPGGYILVKCADYVTSGKLWLGSHYMTAKALELNCQVWDRLIFVGHARSQPKNRTRKDGKPVEQQHARTNWSMLLVLKTPRKKQCPTP